MSVPDPAARGVGDRGTGAGRALPNFRMRRFMLAIQDIMGRSGLTTILRQAGLQRYTGALPPNNSEADMSSADYAAMMQAIENYYGRGARGTLNRIGHAAFDQLVQSRPLQARVYRLLCLALPKPYCKLLVLRWLARELAAPRGQVSVQADGRHLVVIDREGDAAAGRMRDAEICWETLGEIQQALKWATGVDHAVAEFSCKAKGDPACQFEVGEALI